MPQVELHRIGSSGFLFDLFFIIYFISPHRFKGVYRHRQVHWMHQTISHALIHRNVATQFQTIPFTFCFLNRGMRWRQQWVENPKCTLERAAAAATPTSKTVIANFHFFLIVLIKLQQMPGYDGMGEISKMFCLANETVNAGSNHKIDFCVSCERLWSQKQLGICHQILWGYREIYDKRHTHYTHYKNILHYCIRFTRCVCIVLKWIRSIHNSAFLRT